MLHTTHVMRDEVGLLIEQARNLLRQSQAARFTRDPGMDPVRMADLADNLHEQAIRLLESALHRLDAP